MVSFQEMTSDQVRAYVEKAHELQTPYLYSLNRDRSPYNRELLSVSNIIAERFLPRQNPVLPVSYPKMLTKLTKARGLRARLKKKKKKVTRPDYKHIVGCHRMTLNGKHIPGNTGETAPRLGLPPGEASE